MISTRVRRNFAGSHLKAATEAALNAYRVEQNNDTSVHEEMMQCVPVAIIMAGAALEASANEVVQDILDATTSLTVSNGCKLELKDLKVDRSGNSLGKFRRMGRLFDKIPDEGKLPWKDAQILVDARNALMHFRPVDQVDDQEDSKLVKALKTKVPISPPHKSRLIFPHSFLTYGCARWAVLSVLSFSDYFSNLLGVNDRFAGVRQNIVLP
jgi:hypothetical protein